MIIITVGMVHCGVRGEGNDGGWRREVTFLQKYRLYVLFLS